MSLLLTTSVKLQGKPLARELDVACENPQLAQQQLLQKILHQNAGTVFGKEHYFAQITTLKEYRQNTPIRDYEAFRPYIVQRTGTLLPKDYWSNLKLIGCWTGGSVGVQVHKLAAYFGNVPIRDLGYLASEARITLPYQDNTPAGILAINTNFYEFIPEAEIESEQPTVLSCHELELGKRYSILLTTTAGLYRYHINDIVEVTGFYKKTPLLAFIRKGQDMTNITGEKMHANHIVSAIAQVQQQFNLVIATYRLIPNLENNRYELYLELVTPASREWLQQTLIPAIDQALCAANNEYAQKRESKRLQPLCLHLMQPGWSEAELHRFVASGKRDVQYKWKILRSQPSPEDRQAIAITIESHDAFPSIQSTNFGLAF